MSISPEGVLSGITPAISDTTIQNWPVSILATDFRNGVKVGASMVDFLIMIDPTFVETVRHLAHQPS